MTEYVWSIDDAGQGGSKMIESLQKTTEFFDSRGIKSTWFTVPKAGDKPLSAAWKAALVAAKDSGHDIQLHGLTHGDCFEFGPPAWPATIINPGFQEEFDERRDELMKRYTVANLRARIEEGLDIFDRELGVQPTVFRAPCGAISKPMFAALDEVGIKFHTCRYISGTGYAHLPHNSGKIEQEWIDEIPSRPFRWYHGIIEAPIINEYTWRGSGQFSAEYIELAKQDLNLASESSPIVIILMHTHGIADDYDHAFRLIDSVVEHVGSKAGSQFTTLGELASSGALSKAAVGEGADFLAV